MLRHAVSEFAEFVLDDHSICHRVVRCCLTSFLSGVISVNHWGSQSM